MNTTTSGLPGLTHSQRWLFSGFAKLSYLFSRYFSGFLLFPPFLLRSASPIGFSSLTLKQQKAVVQQVDHRRSITPAHLRMDSRTSHPLSRAFPLNYPLFTVHTATTTSEAFHHAGGNATARGVPHRVTAHAAAHTPHGNE